MYKSLHYYNLPPGLNRRLAYGEYISKNKHLNKKSKENKITNANNDITICAICIEPIIPYSYISYLKLSCLHTFHNLCINKWLVQKKECPMCRCRISI
jgi:hypothetical protein